MASSASSELMRSTSSLRASRSGSDSSRAPASPHVRDLCAVAASVRHGAEGVPPRSTERSSSPGSARLATAARTFALRIQ